MSDFNLEEIEARHKISQLDALDEMALIARVKELDLQIAQLVAMLEERGKFIVKQGERRRKAEARVKELESLLSGRTMSCEACNTNAEKLPRAAAVVEAARSLERNARGMAMYVRESGGNTNASVLEHWCEAVREALAAYEKGDGGDA